MKVINEYTSDMPFARFFQSRKKISEADRKLVSHNVYPEIIFLAGVFLSASTWHVGSLALVVWCVALFALITLAVTNSRTHLLPDVLTRPLAVISVVYAVALSLHTNSASPLLSAALGALLVAGVPYVLFQVSSGRWIGGGDVKLGFAAGLLLGWKYGLLCVGLMIVLSFLSFLIEYLSNKLAKSSRATRVGTGTLWALAITTCVLLSQ